MDLALNDLRRLICHKTQTNKAGHNCALDFPNIMLLADNFFFFIYFSKKKKLCYFK